MGRAVARHAFKEMPKYSSGTFFISVLLSEILTPNADQLEMRIPIMNVFRPITLSINFKNFKRSKVILGHL